jgi:hypothetical protein
MVLLPGYRQSASPKDATPTVDATVFPPNVIGSQQPPRPEGFDADLWEARIGCISPGKAGERSAITISRVF